MAKTILVKGTGINKEGIATESILPGLFVERTSTANQIQMRDTVGESVNLIARENEVVGKDIDAAYAANDTILFTAVGPGCEVLAWIKDGQTIAVGAKLQVTTGGTLIAVGAGDPVAIALEAKSPSGADARALVEII
jgi:hypothetical protein